MTIEVKFFASLREQVGKAATELEAGDGLTALEVWQQATGNPELGANILIAVNMEYVGKDQQVVDGDEVAFFPPVTGG
ncbi:MAG: molybdopterin converting factor subunit 1 [Thioalkalispiraceae bacterium]|jgi:molybdopterin synthase sulfur carrier subunit